MSNAKRLLVVQAAGLGYDLLCRYGAKEWSGAAFRPMEPVFPAVTCTAQATFRTALAPTGHGMVGNGLYFRDLRRALFWEQSSALVAGARIWEGFRRAGRTVGMLFWQQSLGEEVDVLLSPAPVHRHGGGMVESFCEKPDGLYGKLCRAVGRRFKLSRYWGPLASVKSGWWIAEAADALLRTPDLAPDLLFVYLPTLDYDLQRFGPDDPRSEGALGELAAQVDRVRSAAERAGYEILIFGDYAIGGVSGAAFPNRALRDAGLMRVRAVRGARYPDLHASRAFAVTDHEVAHVYARETVDIARAAEVLAGTDGVGEVLAGDALAERGLDHARCGELVLVASPGRWFAYPWWRERREAPDYAAHVDIHNKPGYDPCELFFGTFPWHTSLDTDRVRGSHGRAGPERRACWRSSCALEGDPDTLADLALSVRAWLEANA